MTVNRATNLLSTWIQTVKSALLEYLWGIWDKRNKYKHGKNADEVQRKNWKIRNNKFKRYLKTIFHY